MAQTESSELIQEKQDKLHNTYYNNMVMYINNKQGDCRSQTVNIQQGMSHKISLDIYFVKCANVPHIPTRRRSK